MKIGITQRVEEVPSYNERRDCLDQQWYVLLESLGFTPFALPNKLSGFSSYLKSLQLDGFILTGGNDIASLPDPKNPAPERDETECTILNYSSNNKLPVLGVCRGLQMVNVYLGGSLSEVKGHVAKEHKLQINYSSKSFSEFAIVNSYHTKGIYKHDLAKKLKICATASDETIEAVVHTVLPWFGIMWHPERETPFKTENLNLIKKIFERNKR